MIIKEIGTAIGYLGLTFFTPWHSLKKGNPRGTCDGKKITARRNFPAKW
jgi:hypothetical protein